MVDRELITQMLNRMDKLGDQQTEILIKQTELSTDQKHLSSSVDEIIEDLDEVKTVQSLHTDDIRAIKESLKDSQCFKEWVLEFAKSHPIITIIVILMFVNMMLVSLGLPLIDIGTVWTAIGSA